MLPKRPAPVEEEKTSQIFAVVLPELIVEAVLAPNLPKKLHLQTWDGRKAATMPSISHCGLTYQPRPIAGGLAHAIRFPPTSKPFGSAAKLTASMREFLSRYFGLAPHAADLLIAFALASYFVDCFPVAPVLYLLGPDNEAGLILRLLGCLCRRSVLLGDIDMAALGTLPSDAEATLLINQRNLAPRVTRILLASNNRHFCIARGNGLLNAYGAKAFSADPELADGIGMHLGLSPAPDPLPILTDADEKELASDFQSRLLRYRMVNYRRVRDAQIDLRNFVPAIRDEVRAWLAPICDCPDLQKSVSSFCLQKSRNLEGNRVSDDQCVVTEAALFFCHKENTEDVFVGELAGCVNALLEGRHEDRTLTDKKVGLLLRAVGIHGERVVKGYRIELTESVRQQIHRVARAYHVLSAQDGVASCSQCSNVE